MIKATLPKKPKVHLKDFKGAPGFPIVAVTTTSGYCGIPTQFILYIENAITLTSSQMFWVLYDLNNQ